MNGTLFSDDYFHDPFCSYLCLSSSFDFIQMSQHLQTCYSHSPLNNSLLLQKGRFDMTFPAVSLL